ncbi:MAG: RNA polymerase sigma factor [Proteobacteria bacterium]|nr:RNA polymerase sigma factor [Pseudomonadota bacterium]
MARISRADTGALESLYKLYRPRLHRFLLALSCPEAELDEICNETFYVVWRRARSFDGSSRLSTWIFGIARNKVMDLNRSARRRNRNFVEKELETLPEMRMDNADRLELGQCLEIALGHLPADQRTVIELAFVDGLSYEEIARVMDCPESTVKTRMFHARRKLKHGFPELMNTRNRRTPG